MFRLSVRSLLRICSAQTLCWLGIAFVLMQCFILPSARREVQALVNSRERIDNVILWHPGELPCLLARYNAHARTLYAATELTAGVVNTMLLLCLLCVAVVYVFFKLRLPIRQMKRLMLLSLGAAVMDIVVVLSIVFLLSAGSDVPSTFIPWIRGFCIIRIAAYTGLLVGLVYLILRRNRYAHASAVGRVNSN